MNNLPVGVDFVTTVAVITNLVGLVFAIALIVAGFFFIKKIWGKLF